MNIVKRGLIALAVTAAVGGTAGSLLATAASATSSRGREVIRSTQYEVGAGEAVGPWSGHGVVNTRGNIANVPSLTTDLANTNRTTLVDPTGSFTVLTSGGTPGTFHSNPVTCAFRVNIKGINGNIASGTGAYAKATGSFKINLHVEGFLPRLASGACDTSQSTPSAFETDTAVAVGHVNLHNAPMVTPAT
jgi:hypothetical protein